MFPCPPPTVNPRFGRPHGRRTTQPDLGTPAFEPARRSAPTASLAVVRAWSENGLPAGDRSWPARTV